MSSTTTVSLLLLPLLLALVLCWADLSRGASDCPGCFVVPFVPPNLTDYVAETYGTRALSGGGTLQLRCNVYWPPVNHTTKALRYDDGRCDEDAMVQQQDTLHQG
jgi:hypothetical protein